MNQATKSYCKIAAI